MTRKFGRLLAPIGLLMLWASPSLKAQTIVFTDFATPGPPPSGFNPAPGPAYPVNGIASGSFLVDAMQFTTAPAASGAWKINNLFLALSNTSGATTGTVFIVTDNAGIPSSTVLDTDVFGGLTAAPTVVPVASTSQPVLAPSTKYWLEVQSDTNAKDLWYLNSVGANGQVAFEDGASIPNFFNGGNAPLAAFQLQGQLVPEGDSLLYLCGGGIPFGALYLLRRLRNRRA